MRIFSDPWHVSFFDFFRICLMVFCFETAVRFLCWYIKLSPEKSEGETYVFRMLFIGIWQVQNGTALLGLYSIIWGNPVIDHWLQIGILFLLMISTLSGTIYHLTTYFTVHSYSTGRQFSEVFKRFLFCGIVWLGVEFVF